jgi:hypothetical protein
MDSAAFVCKVSPFSNLWIKQIPNSSILLYEQSSPSQENKLECRGGEGVSNRHPLADNFYDIFSTFLGGLSSFLGFAGKLRTAG